MPFVCGEAQRYPKIQSVDYRYHSSPPASPPWPASLAQLNRGPCPTNPSLARSSSIETSILQRPIISKLCCRLIRLLRSWFEPRCSLVIGKSSIDTMTSLKCRPAHCQGVRSPHAKSAVPTTADRGWQVHMNPTHRFAS